MTAGAHLTPIDPERSVDQDGTDGDAGSTSLTARPAIRHRVNKDLRPIASGHHPHRHGRQHHAVQRE
ncbi:hypothetical protein Rmf_31090 [Roseomonas fluvialis]|uniref:Uncharacterized protein n=1 Tax=Roseomonas fluvialis TaxID=1750527 RepID=A0ABN6P3F7_9PROT|nr:hypothetical protein Rmf_31090 [Roseomonas fluvialis]